MVLQYKWIGLLALQHGHGQSAFRLILILAESAGPDLRAIYWTTPCDGWVGVWNTTLDKTIKVNLIYVFCKSLIKTPWPFLYINGNQNIKTIFSIYLFSSYKIRQNYSNQHSYIKVWLDYLNRGLSWFLSFIPANCERSYTQGRLWDCETVSGFGSNLDQFSSKLKCNFFL